MDTKKSTLSITEDFDVFDWLKDYEPPFHHIKEQDITSILHFCLMWSLFESTACDNKANLTTIKKAVEKLCDSGKLKEGRFEATLSYFMKRYLNGSDTNTIFEKLNFRLSDKRELVESVLKGEETNCDSILFALLIIVYRLRNNLFHGEKWGDKLAEQATNFTVANRLLANVLELEAGTT